MKLSARHKVRIYRALDEIQEMHDFHCEVLPESASAYFRVTYMPAPSYRFLATLPPLPLQAALHVASLASGFQREGDPARIQVTMTPGVTGTSETRTVEDFDACLRYLRKWLTAAAEEHRAVHQLAKRGGADQPFDAAESKELVDDILSDVDEVAPDIKSRIDELNSRLDVRLQEIKARIQELQEEVDLLKEQDAEIPSSLEHEKQELSQDRETISRLQFVLGHAQETFEQLPVRSWLAKTGVWIRGAVKDERTNKAVSLIRLCLLFLVGYPELLLTTPDVLNLLQSDRKALPESREDHDAETEGNSA